MKQAALMSFALSLCVVSSMSADAATKADAPKGSYLTNATGTVTWDGIAATDNGQFSCLKPANGKSALFPSGETWTITLTRPNSSGTVTPFQFTKSDGWQYTVTITGPVPASFPSTLYLVTVQSQSVGKGVESVSLQGENVNENSCIHGDGTKTAK